MPEALRIHDLKTWPEYYELLVTGKKTDEIRKDDRPYRVGNFVRLREWDSIRKEYTGRFIQREIVAVLRGGAVPDGMVFLCLRKPPSTFTEALKDAHEKGEL